MRGGSEFMQTSYRSLIVTAVLALVFGFAGAAVWSLTGLADARTKSYLLDNPQLLPEMAEAWQAQIGRASCRERVCQYGVDLGGRRIIKKKKNMKLDNVKKL